MYSVFRIGYQELQRSKKEYQQDISHVREKWIGDKKWNKCKYYVHFNDELKEQERMSDRERRSGGSETDDDWK